MSRVPLSELSHGGEKLSESAEYVVQLLLPAVNQLSERVAKLEERSSVLESLASKNDLDDLRTNLMQVVAILDGKASSIDMVSALNIVSAKIDALKAGVIAFAEKVDVEDVTNLDTDYAATVSPLLT